jgi:SUN domain-containing protein 1/2
VVGIFLIIGAALVSSYFLPTPWSTSLPASSSPGLFNAISSRITHSWDVLIEWVRDEDIPGVNSPIVDGYGTSVSGPRYEPLFSRTTKLERRAKAIESSLKILKQHLPSDIVVTRNEKGELEILNEFWRALVSKLKADGITNITHSFDGEWRTFLDKNRQKILDILRDEANNPELKHKNLEVLHRDEFISLMQDEYTKLGRLVDKKITEAYHSMSKGVKALIKDDVNKIIMDQIRIESLAMANLVANAEINLRKVNYFSTGLGARIDPYETSSTFIDDEPAVTSLYRRLFPGPGRRPPITALQKWDEPGDCWCASPDETNQGFAQLSILLGHEMYPQQVTVEHLPKAASLDSTSAPKNIEVWVPLPYDPSIRVWSAAGCGQGPKNHYCLGNFAYNVHGSNHVQTFNLDVHSIIPASKVLLRVTDNWGSDHTCIYRVRLHGEPVVAAE